jgi:starch phosphorylase
MENIAASPGLAEAIEAVRSGVFSPDEPARYAAMIDDLTNHDYFMVTADFDAYASAQRSIDKAYADSGLWTRRAILNTARMGWFSSDRAIREYASDIWKAAPSPPAGARE